MNKRYKTFTEDKYESDESVEGNNKKITEEGLYMYIFNILYT